MTPAQLDVLIEVELRAFDEDAPSTSPAQRRFVTPAEVTQLASLRAG